MRKAQERQIKERGARVNGPGCRIPDSGGMLLLDRRLSFQIFLTMSDSEQ
jgi:hypothetical protein